MIDPSPFLCQEGGPPEEGEPPKKPEKTDTEKAIDDAIEGLGNDDPDKRDAAKKKLQELGNSHPVEVVDALNKALPGTTDLTKKDLINKLLKELTLLALAAPKVTQAVDLAKQCKTDDAKKLLADAKVMPAEFIKRIFEEGKNGATDAQKTKLDALLTWFRSVLIDAGWDLITNGLTNDMLGLVAAGLDKMLPWFDGQDKKDIQDALDKVKKADASGATVDLDAAEAAIQGLRDKHLK